MTTFVSTFNLFLYFVFSLCYMYQLVYALVVLVKDHRRKVPEPTAGKLNRYAVLISGRNEEKVIGELVKSIKNQDYPSELIDVFVIADNCTDNTAEVAREAGAEVFVRNDKLVVGKATPSTSHSTRSASSTATRTAVPTTTATSSSTPTTSWTRASSPP